MHHSDFIAKIASIYKPNLYLELGLYKGETWKKVSPFCNKMVGVDIVDRQLGGEIYIETTDSFFTHFRRNIDMVFIDADHSYEGVHNDILKWLPKVKSGGIISGHDYGLNPAGVNRFPGVDRAVHELLGEENIKTGPDLVWWTEK